MGHWKYCTIMLLFEYFCNRYRYYSGLVSWLEPPRKRNWRLEFQAWTKTLLFKSKKPWIQMHPYKPTICISKKVTDILYIIYSRLLSVMIPWMRQFYLLQKIFHFLKLHFIELLLRTITNYDCEFRFRACKLLYADFLGAVFHFSSL